MYQVILGLGLGVVPPLAEPPALVARPAPVPCICGQSDQCKCEEGKCPGGCPVQSISAKPYTEPPFYSAREYAAAFREMKQTGRACVLVFTDPVGCLPCKRLEAGALADPAVRSAMQNTVNVKALVRSDAGAALAAKFGVTGWPTVLVYRDGKLAANLSGNVTAAELLSAITR